MSKDNFLHDKQIKNVDQCLSPLVNSNNNNYNNAEKTVVEISTIKLKDNRVSRKRTLPEKIPAFGLICTVFSVFLGSLQWVIVKVLTELNPIQILVFRCILQFIVYGIATIYKKYHILGPKENRIYMGVRCLAATIMFLTVYLAYRMMPIADAATLYFSSPVFVTIFAYFLIKEKITVIQMFTCFFAFMGVVFIAKPKFLFGDDSNTVYEKRVEGSLLAITAAVMGAFGQIILRKIKSTPVAINVMWFSASCIASGTAILCYLNALVWPTGWRVWSLLIACAILGVFDQYFFTLAFQYENAGPISVARTFSIVFSFIWGVIILSEKLSWSSLVGACIVSSCIVSLGLHKWKTENPAQFKKIFGKLVLHKETKRNDSVNTGGVIA